MTIDQESGIFSIFSDRIIKKFGKKFTFMASMVMFVGFVPMCLIALIFNIKDPAYITLMITVLSIGVAIPLNFAYVFALNSIPGASSRISAIMAIGKWVLSIIGFQVASYLYTNDFRSTGWMMFGMEIISIMITFYLLKNNKAFRAEMLG